jgi:hypothetical protein
MVIVAGTVVVEFVLSFAGAVYGTPSRSILGSASSLDTSSRGTAALAQLLSARGHQVHQLEDPLNGAPLPERGTLFVLDPQKNQSGELAAISRYVMAGGRAVLAGRPANRTLRALLGTGPLPIWQSAQAGQSTPLAPAPENYAVSTVVSNGIGSWRYGATIGPVSSRAGSARVLLGGPGGGLALLASVGRGRLVLLASASPLDNGDLALADNAAFALDLAGPAGSPVTFDEYDHLESSAGAGIAGLPGHWQAALLLGLLAVVVWILSAARRFGPPMPAERDLVPPRIAHVDALAALLASGSPSRLMAGAAPLRRAARERLCRALGARSDATDPDLVLRAASTTMPPELATAVLVESGLEEDLLALGRAYATLSERGRWS